MFVIGSLILLALFALLAQNCFLKAFSFVNFLILRQLLKLSAVKMNRHDELLFGVWIRLYFPKLSHEHPRLIAYRLNEILFVCTCLHLEALIKIVGVVLSEVVLEYSGFEAN